MNRSMQRMQAFVTMPLEMVFSLIKEANKCR